jgi:hypothetical protein
MVLVVEINGAAGPPADEECDMKVYSGFYDLLKDAKSLPKTGWIFVESEVNMNSPESIYVAQFFIAESELEEIELERSKRTFVECPTLVDIISVLDKRSLKPSEKDYLCAVIYYREYDDFQE